MEAWDTLFTRHGVEVFVVCDAESAEPFMRGWTSRVPDPRESPDYYADTGAYAPPSQYPTYFAWPDIPDFIPRKTDMIRSWGIYQAWKSGTTYTLSLDDDVRPDGDLFAAYEEVFDAGAVCSPYLDVGALTSFDGQLRGFPYRDREPAEVAVQYGGWQGVLDFDAQTQLDRQPGADHRFAPIVLPVPRGAAVTGCIMNCAWRTSYARLMWQLPLYEGRYNRFGDIWSGLFQKKVLDQLGKVMVINGKASVLHKRASDPHANLERERPGIPLNEDLWARLVSPRYESDPHSFFFVRDKPYADHFRKCREQWLNLFS